MKHAALMDDRDKDDINRSDALIVEGKSIRKRVLARLRARAFRSKDR